MCRDVQSVRGAYGNCGSPAFWSGPGLRRRRRRRRQQKLYRCSACKLRRRANRVICLSVYVCVACVIMACGTKTHIHTLFLVADDRNMRVRANRNHVCVCVCMCAQLSKYKLQPYHAQRSAIAHNIGYYNINVRLLLTPVCDERENRSLHTRPSVRSLSFVWLERQQATHRAADSPIRSDMVRRTGNTATVLQCDIECVLANCTHYTGWVAVA